MEGVPTELLERVLAHLAPADLVRARAVCARWHAAVARLERCDRAFWFACGAADLGALAPQLPHAAPLERMYDILFDEYGVACTCGALLLGRDHVVGAWREAAKQQDDLAPARHRPWPAVAGPPVAASAAFRPAKRQRMSAPAPYRYAARHDGGGHAPARWEILARARSLALELLAPARLLSANVHTIDFWIHRGGYTSTWILAWVHLPPDVVRPPTTPAAVKQLAQDLLMPATRRLESRAALLESLARPAEARAYYRRPEVAAAETARLASFNGSYRRYEARWADAMAAAKAAEAAGDAAAVTEAMRQRVWAAFPTSASHKDATRLAVQPHLADPAAMRAFLAPLEAHARSYDSGILGTVRTFLRGKAEGAAVWEEFAGFLDAHRRAEEEAVLQTPAPPPAVEATWLEGWRLPPVSAGRTPAGGSRNYPPEDVHEVEQRMEAAYPDLFSYAARGAVRAADLSGWDIWRWEARKSAALWRYAVQQGWAGLYRSELTNNHRPPLAAEEPWAQMTDARLTAVLDRMVTTVDDVKAEFDARFGGLSVVAHAGSDAAWVGGLSPDGHLVGVMTIHQQGD